MDIANFILSEQYKKLVNIIILFDFTSTSLFNPIEQPPLFSDSKSTQNPVLNRGMFEKMCKNTILNKELRIDNETTFKHYLSFG